MQQIPSELLAQLKQRYDEPHRAYHSWAHIEALLKHFHNFKSEFENVERVLWALYWHDAIYDPLASDNEAKSAELLKTDASGILQESMLLDVMAIINATAKHHIPESIRLDLKVDMEWFLDMDLSILGQSAEVFDEYEKAIQLEYSAVPLELYHQGRKVVLQSFLSREVLYFTPQCRDLWEKQARDNLTRSINMLS